MGDKKRKLYLCPACRRMRRELQPSGRDNGRSICLWCHLDLQRRGVPMRPQGGGGG